MCNGNDISCNYRNQTAVQLGRAQHVNLQIAGLHANTRFCICVCHMKLCGSNQIAVFCLCHKSPTNSCTCTLTAFQSSKCSSVIVQSKSCADSTEHRKCSLVARKELGYSGLKPEQLEVITVFVGGREVFTIVCLDWVWKKSLLQLFANSLWFYYWAKNMLYIICICSNGRGYFVIHSWHLFNTKLLELPWHKTYYWCAIQLSVEVIC